MAKEIHERENLLRDATALVPRLQLQLRSNETEQEVFVGFREDALSLYFDSDPVYHFHSSRQLRRAFVDDRLIKALKGRLIAMRPRRGPYSTDLVSRELSPEEQDQFGLVLHERIALLRSALCDNSFELVGQVPPEGDALPRLTQWLTEFPGLQIAKGPRVG